MINAMIKMNAVVCDESGALRVAAVERPKPGPTEVLVRVSIAGVNPVDWKTRHGGGVAFAFPDPTTRILGWDLAGTVVETGPGVTRFGVGDRVFGMPRFPHPAEAYAEYVVSRSRELAAIPESVDDATAGATPLAALTAWQGLFDTLAISSGDRILIHSASGGVGHIAVQLAKSKGAQVWGTASATNHEALRQLGCDHPIDYRSETFETVATEMDHVLDLYGLNDYPTRSLRCLRPGGQLLVIPSASALPDPDLVARAQVQVTNMLVEPDYAALEAIAVMLESGDLKVIVSTQMPLAEIAELHAIGESGGPMGKLVARVS